MYKIKPISNIKKKINIPPDKSIFQRAVIISAILGKKTALFPFITNDDINASLNCIEKLGVKLEKKKNSFTIYGEKLYFKIKKDIKLNAKQSATTLRILSGVLCGQKFSSYFDAEPSLRKRPMSRIIIPLKLMGADISGIKKDSEEYPPLLINPSKLKGISYKMPIASAQVKSAILLASLYAEGKTEIFELHSTRDHTERMLSLFGVKIKKENKKIVLDKIKIKSVEKLFIPGDFSSASFFIVLAALLKNSEVLLKDVNINPTRTQLLRVLERMNANIKIINKKKYFEPYGDILVKSSSLKATDIRIDEVPLMIDEIPIFCVAASFAEGTSTIYGVKELTVKESNRINSIVSNLRKIGVDINVKKFNINKEENLLIKIRGKKIYKSNIVFESFSDHRIAMSMIVLGKVLDGESYIDNIKCIDKSFPEFVSIIDSL